jgi:hypothetical protein
MARRSYALLIACILALATRAYATDVDVRIAPRETQVGLPVTLTIVIESADSYEMPRIPQIDGATVGPPRTSKRSETSIIQGRTTHRSFITLTYSITPDAAGTLKVPSIQVMADGERFSSQPAEVIVHEVGSSATTGNGDVELIEAAVTGNRQRIYLGEPIVLTLRIWVRPYRDQRYDLTLSERDMWSLFKLDASNWGPFTAQVSELAARRQMPRVQETLRPDTNGNRRSYYVYELTTEVWPRQTGPLEIEPVTILMEYPTRLDRRRRFFNEELVVGSSRTLVVQAAPPAVQVAATPSAGQPATFAGAVGDFTISSTAKPTEVAVGDPITITMSITDRTPGGTEMDLLQPPPLNKVQSITENFRVPTDPLAGVVQGRTKTFTQTIRALNDTVDRIPAIPFSFFRPGVEEYETVWSASIPIHVTPADEMALTEVIESVGQSRPATTELTSVSGGLLANYTDHDMLLVSRQLTLRWWTWVLLAAPPLLFVATVISQRRVRRLRHDTAYVRRRGARRKAMDQIRSASDASTNVAARAEHLTSAISGYVADRCDLPSGALTRTEIIQRLRAASVNPNLVQQVETVLSRCEQCRYSGSADGDLQELIRDAKGAIEGLERERIR